MMKLRLSIIAASLMCGALLTNSVKAQTGPCGWDLTTVITQPTCYKVCNGSISIAPTVNWDDFQYLWSNGDTTDLIIDLCENEYTVTVTDDKKCEQTYTFSIIEPTEVIVSCVTLTNESEYGMSDGSIMASASGGDGNLTYEWQTVPMVSGALLSGVSGGTYSVIVYDGNDCTATTSCEVITEKKEKKCEGFRTQTMGGWGQCQQNGNNPGTYLFAHFAASFPNGLVLGCANASLTLSSAQAVCDFLPSGSTAAQLPLGVHMSNPGGSYNNVFAGQLAAAMINAKFDADDANFAPNSDYTLGELIITSGVFENWTVNDVIAEANKKIGRCGSPYTISALKNAMAHINQNYVDGLVDKGFLACPGDKKDNRNSFISTSDMTVQIAPNPVREVSNISIYSEENQKLSVELYSLSGQQIKTMYSGRVASGSFKNVSFDATDLNNGIYIVRIVTETQVLTQKIVVNK